MRGAVTVGSVASLPMQASAFERGIDVRSEHEVGAGQSLDRVRPELDPESSPGDREIWMVSLGLSDHSDPYSAGKRPGEIGDTHLAAQPGLVLRNLPRRVELRLQLLQLNAVHSRHPAVTRLAAFLPQRHLSVSILS